MGESLSFFKEAFQLKDVDAGMYSPLVLAYVGDAVYEIMIRTKVVNGGSVQVNKLHKHSAALVKAETQAEMIIALKEELTEEEAEELSEAEVTENADTAAAANTESEGEKAEEAEEVTEEGE